MEAEDSGKRESASLNRSVNRRRAEFRFSASIQNLKLAGNLVSTPGQKLPDLQNIQKFQNIQKIQNFNNMKNFQNTRVFRGHRSLCLSCDSVGETWRYYSWLHLYWGETLAACHQLQPSMQKTNPFKLPQQQPGAIHSCAHTLLITGDSGFVFCQVPL